MAISTDLGVWLGALITIAVYSYFFGSDKNPIFKLAECTVIGGSIGYTIVIAGAKNLESLAYNKILAGNLMLLIPVAMGLLIFTRYTSNYSHLARIPISFIIGSGIAVAAYGTISTNLIRNNMKAVSSYLVFNNSGEAFANIWNILALLATVYYFYFTGGKKQESAPYTWMNKLGRYSIMLYMGASFGNTILARNSLIIGRAQFLLYTWLGLTP